MSAALASIGLDTAPLSTQIGSSVSVLVRASASALARSPKLPTKDLASPAALALARDWNGDGLNLSAGLSVLIFPLSMTILPGSIPALSHSYRLSSGISEWLRASDIALFRRRSTCALFFA